MGLATMAIDGGIAQVVRVVGMEHRPVNDGVGQVRRTAAVASQLQLNPMQAPVVIEADVVLDIEGVTLACHQHVFDPGQTHFGRLSGQHGDHRAQARRACRLRFLAAKSTAHAAHIDHDFVHRHAEYFRHQLLYFGGVLRRAIDNHAPVFGGHHRRDLGFQVKVFLPADVQMALQAMGRTGESAGRITALMGMAVEDEMFFAQGFDHIQDGFQVFVFDDRGHCCFACGFHIPCGNRDHRLADEFDDIDGQQRIARQQRTNVLEARNVFMGDGDAHAFKGIAR